MRLTAHQEQAVQTGHLVQLRIDGVDCVLLRKDVYERGEALDFSPWTHKEMDLLAAVTADLLAGDGFDEPDDA